MDATALTLFETEESKFLNTEESKFSTWSRKELKENSACTVELKKQSLRTFIRPTETALLSAYPVLITLASLPATTFA